MADLPLVDLSWRAAVGPCAGTRDAVSRSQHCRAGASGCNKGGYDRRRGHQSGTVRQCGNAK
eukprot:3398839-Prymnesium_polylepis.1